MWRGVMQKGCVSIAYSPSSHSQPSCMVQFNLMRSPFAKPDLQSLLGNWGPLQGRQIPQVMSRAPRMRSDSDRESCYHPARCSCSQSKWHRQDHQRLSTCSQGSPHRSEAVNCHMSAQCHSERRPFSREREVLGIHSYFQITNASCVGSSVW